MNAKQTAENGAGCKPGCKPGGACRWIGCANAESPALRDVLAEHFVMWHDLNGPGEPGPRGEWRCQCGKRFGFSDSAIDHQAEMLTARVFAPVEGGE